MINETFTINGVTYKQINKTTARKLFEGGQTIYLQPSNMRFGNARQSPCRISNDKDSAIGRAFDDHCNDFKHYNCNSETGYYIHFYIKVS